MDGGGARRRQLNIMCHAITVTTQSPRDTVLRSLCHAACMHYTATRVLAGVSLYGVGAKV